jgi:hypothetical protein
LTEGLGAGSPSDPNHQARRQSMLVRERESEHEALRFISEAVDLMGWK